MTKYTPEQRINAFWNKVNKNGSIPEHCPELGQCWEWNKSLNRKGYGLVDLNGSSCHAHRFSWIITNGEIPNNLWVLHKCDNRKCVNPAHLFLGTNQDNVDDMIRKGRKRVVTGEAHPFHKLKESDVIEIRYRYKLGGISRAKLAEEYSVSTSTIQYIVENRNWKHLL